MWWSFLNHHLTQTFLSLWISFLQKNCIWMSTLFSHSMRLWILLSGLILTGYFLLQDEQHKENSLSTKLMLLTDPWCFHENMNQGIFLPLCKGWDMPTQAPSRALNGGAEDPAQADTRTWRELPCRVLRSHSRIVMLPSLDCPILYCLWPHLSHSPPTKAQFHASGLSWNL